MRPLAQVIDAHARERPGALTFVEGSRRLTWAEYAELRAGTSLDLEGLILHLERRGESKETFPERLVVQDSLPRSSGGKVAKQALREDIRQRLAEESS